ncbi:MAG: baseplate J/gp47 family protein [Solirubrobacteraceae bacterium]
MRSAGDRRQLLAASGAPVNGIDFVYVAASQTQLFVHFQNMVTVKGSLSGDAPVTITGGEVVKSVAVNPIDEATDWSVDSQGRPVLALEVPAPGDFSTYTLAIRSTNLDPFFDQVSFSFKAGCPSTLDCAAPATNCPEPPDEQVAIDYLAKDFASFRQALSEFSLLRYPAWVERSEADLGVMLMEAFAALADELSYYQDRVAAESSIQTATQRLSVVRHARLVDYEPAPATAATTWLQLDVSPIDAPATGWTITSPLRLAALTADGSVVDFEVEDPAAGLAGSSDSSPAPWVTVDTRWNRASALTPYYWDQSRSCLRSGATELYLLGHGLGFNANQQLLLDTSVADGANAPVRELVTVASATETQDLLGGGIALTAISLQTATTADHNLDDTVVAGNIVPAVQGARQTETFTIPLPGTASPAPVVVRIGANWTPEDPLPDYRYCLSSSPLAWIATSVAEEDTATPVKPEIILTQLPSLDDESPGPWSFARWLLDAGPSDREFTLTPEQYSPVLTSDGTTWFDYDGDGGTTIRFGDGTFGVSPSPGTAFQVVYRVGGGLLGNVPADTIISPVPGLSNGVSACTNPFAATGGADAETIAQVRARAPQQFSAKLLRVVLAADYEACAQSLPWVQQAGSAFRWTGSWLTVLTSADPVGSEEPTILQLQQLTALLDQQRLAGYESYVTPPVYVSVDLQITVIGGPAAFASDVETAVLTRLNPGTLVTGGAGFFDHSQWGFGQPLESSALFAAIQGCTGVVGVTSVLYRKRGAQTSYTALPETLTLAANQILRVDNDPSRPEAGSLQVTVKGSK